jgi:hypothetical protein
MSILQVKYFCPNALGGLETQVRPLAEQLVVRGYDVTTAVDGGSVAAPTREQAVTRDQLLILNSYSHWIDRLSTIRWSVPSSAGRFCRRPTLRGRGASAKGHLWPRVLEPST